MLQRLENRYVFIGNILLESALHIGGGESDGQITQSPVIKGGDGSPFIPGSSIKGAFRASVERIIDALGYRPCFLFAESDVCLTTNEAERKAFEDNRKDMREEEITEFLREKLCPSCLLFGSPFSSGRVRFTDAYLQERYVQTQVRDGVGIDRDSGIAVKSVKFDYEAVPAGVSFAFHLAVENLGDRELGMIAAGLQEMRSGYVPLGGLKTRGLGRCKLELSSVEILVVARQEGPDLQALKQYLKSGKGTVCEAQNIIEKMLNCWIDVLFEGDKEC